MKNTPKHADDIQVAKDARGKYWYTEHEVEDGADQFRLTQGTPTVNVEKNQVYSVLISAPSGAGKSYKANELITQLLDKFPKKNQPTIFYFTTQTEPDPAYEKLIKKEHTVINDKGKKTQESIWQVVDINSEDLFSIPIEVYKNSVVLFDDWETNNSKDIRDGLHKLLVAFLSRGRKLGIHVISIIHTTLQANFTRDLHFESRVTILYPKYQIKTTASYLKNYMGFEEEDIRMVKNRRTRSMYIHKIIPQYCVTDDMVWLL